MTLRLRLILTVLFDHTVFVTWNSSLSLVNNIKHVLGIGTSLENQWRCRDLFSRGHIVFLRLKITTGEVSNGAWRGVLSSWSKISRTGNRDMLTFLLSFRRSSNNWDWTPLLFPLPGWLSGYLASSSSNADWRFGEIRILKEIGISCFRFP